MITRSHLLALTQEGENYLQQHGVKGMKWGVRRKTDTSSRSAALSTVLEIGRGVSVAVLSTAGGIAVGAAAGPLAGVATGAGIRTGLTIATSSSPKQRAVGIVKKTGMNTAKTGTFALIGAGAVKLMTETGVLDTVTTGDLQTANTEGAHADGKTWSQIMAESGMKYNPKATLDPSQVQVRGEDGTPSAW